MGTIGQRLRLRCFLEGVEVPIIAAQVQSQPNSPVVASIQIPPLAEATRFHPRTLVHLFFLEGYDASLAPVQRTGRESVATEPTVWEQQKKAKENDPTGKKDDSADAKLDKYKVMFIGEVVGFQWSKNPTQRSIVLQCMDVSNYWDHAYQFNNTDIFGPGIKAMFSGGSTNLFTDFLDTESSVIIHLIQTPSRNYPKLKGLMGGIVHLLEALSGYYYETDWEGKEGKGNRKKFAGQNIFFSIAELRLHLTQMITAYDQDKTASTLLQSDGFGGLFGRILGGLGSQVSFRQAINSLMNVIFHETYGQPCPLYVPGTQGSISGSVKRKVKDIPAFAADVKALIKAFNDSKDSIYFSSPAEYQEKSQKVSGKELANSFGRGQQEAIRIAQYVRGKGWSGAASYVDRLTASLGLLKTYAAGWAIGKMALTNKIEKELDKAIKTGTDLLELEVTTVEGDKVVPARLNQQIFRPDVWFTAPPRCNVLFPDQYFQLSYARNFLQEPTRLLLKTNDEFFGEDELFDQFFFAPKAFSLKAESNELNKLLQGDILKHELYTGILPIFEKMGELNIFATKAAAAQYAAEGTPASTAAKMQDASKLTKLTGISSGDISTVTTKSEVALRGGTGVSKMGLAQRATNFLYFKYRFASRQMTVSARFNPYIACGFPGLIIDKYIDRGKLEMYNGLLAAAGKPTRDIMNQLGTHFLANFTAVSHNMDQGNGTTTITCGFARQAEESVEFLGANQEEGTHTVLVKKGEGSRVTTVASIIAPKVGFVGPMLGRITNVMDVTSSYVNPSMPDMVETLPLLGGSKQRDSSGRLKVKVEVGVAQEASAYGPEVVEFVGDKNLVVRFRAYKVEETAPRYTKDTVDLSAEELIRPGWYGPCWHSTNVGEVYQQFFRTGAITDTTQITAADGGYTSSDPSSDRYDSTSAVGADDPKASALSRLSLVSNQSIENAVAFLVLTYSYIKQRGLSADEFIKAYTWRPIATMLDMFGTSDLQLDAEGRKVVQGIEGFHSRAFSDRSDLFGLVTPEITSILGMKSGSTAATQGDVRGPRRAKVLDYVTALKLSRGLLG